MVQMEGVKCLPGTSPHTHLFAGLGSLGGEGGPFPGDPPSFLLSAVFWSVFCSPFKGQRDGKRQPETVRWEEALPHQAAIFLAVLQSL